MTMQRKQSAPQQHSNSDPIKQVLGRRKSKIIHGEALAELRKIPNDCFDTIITDPPYGLSFMGRKWDCAVPSVELWRECLRVLKPGGTALIFAGSRTQHRMTVNIEDAGFIIKDCIMWLYSSGFPKATDIAKGVDRKAGKTGRVIGKKVLPEGFAFAGERYITKNGRSEKNITVPSTAEAKRWHGWKSHSLKPAYEPIIVAMKPNDGSYADNALKWGVSGLNIDGGRIVRTDNDNEPGRFPANIIHDGIDEPWSRYFYCAKASKAERNAGCEKLNDTLLARSDGAQQAQKDGKTEYMQSVFNKRSVTKNSHPTVKPLALMHYLARLTKTPSGGSVLDPFMGSGTTGAACKAEGRLFVGIEMEKQYCQVARCRIEHATYVGANDNTSPQKDLRYLSLFSGIGGFEQGLTQAVKKNSKIDFKQHVSAIAKSIDMLPQSTNHISTTQHLAMSHKSIPHDCRILTCLLPDFLVRLFQSPENDKAFATHEARCFLRLHGLLGKSNHAFFCLKTSKGFYLTTKDIHSVPSSQRLMNWGMTSNGKCLTARISAFRKTASACSLSDILEEQPDRKYFLSKRVVRRLLSYHDTSAIPLPRDTTTRKHQERILVKVGSMHRK